MKRSPSIKTLIKNLEPDELREEDLLFEQPPIDVENCFFKIVLPLHQLPH